MIRSFTRRKFSTEPDFHPHSTIKYLSKSGSVKKKSKDQINENAQVQTKNETLGYRENEMKIQMISKSLYQQIFGNQEQYPKINPHLIQKLIKYFQANHEINYLYL